MLPLPIPLTELWPMEVETLTRPRFGRDSRQIQYVVKDGHALPPGAPVCVNEWLATKLARAVGIAVPDCCSVLLPDGKTTAFGSVYHSPSPTSFVSLLDNQRGVQQYVDFTSSLFAYDLFISNPDRNFGNYIVPIGQNNSIILAIDFDSCGITKLFQNVLPMHSSTLTVSNIIYINNKWRFNKQVAYDTLAKIEEIDVATIATFVSHMPAEWLTRADAETLYGWWDGSGRRERIEQIRKEVGDGTYV